MLSRTTIPRSRLSILFSILFSSSSLISFTRAAIQLQDTAGVELTTFENTDLVFSTSLSNVIEGNLRIADFLSFDHYDDFTGSGQPAGGCLIKRELYDGTILVVPFDVAKENGCNTYADIISRNHWTTDDALLDQMPNQSPVFNDPPLLNQTTMPNITIPSIQKRRHIEKRRTNLNSETKRTLYTKGDQTPQVIILTSMNGGDPGAKEPLLGDRQVLKKSMPLISLLTPNDMSNLLLLENSSVTVLFSSDIGPYRRLLNTPFWHAWSIIFYIIYGIISVAATYFTVQFFRSFGWTTRHPGIVILPIIIYTAAASALVLALDPYNIRQDRISILDYTLITSSTVFLLCLSYALLLFSWITAAYAKRCTSEGEQQHPIWFDTITRLSKKLIVPIVLFMLATFIVNVLNAAKPGITDSIIIPSIIWQVFVILGIICGYLVFTGFMIDSLVQWSNDQESNKRRITFEPRIDPVDHEEALQISIITIVLISTFSTFAIPSAYFSQTKPTLDNFITSQIITDLSTTLTQVAFLVLLNYYPLRRHFGFPNYKNFRLAKLQILKTSEDPTPEQVAEDDLRNSAAYTKRVEIVRPPIPVFTINVIKPKSVVRSGDVQSQVMNYQFLDSEKNDCVMDKEENSKKGVSFNDVSLE